MAATPDETVALLVHPSNGEALVYSLIMFGARAFTWVAGFLIISSLMSMLASFRDEPEPQALRRYTPAWTLAFARTMLACWTMIVATLTVTAVLVSAVPFSPDWLESYAGLKRPDPRVVTVTVVRDGEN